MFCNIGAEQFYKKDIRMRQLFICLFIIILVSGCNLKNIVVSIHPVPDKNFPRWLKSGNFRTSQTSGITFIGSVSGGDVYLLADDIGDIHHLTIKDDTVFSFSKIYFNNKVEKYFENFPKRDFEEISYDRFTNDLYLSVEGNGNDFLKYNNIYKLHFSGNDVFSDTVTEAEKLNITPAGTFTKYLNANIGYEGLAVDSRYLYLGLENMFNLNYGFTDSTLILVVDKNNLEIVKEISTAGFNISTICGLFCNEDYNIYGIDRNNRKMFTIGLNKDLDINNVSLYEIKTVIPGYHQFEYSASLESITMNDKNEIFLVDDPWYEHFVPAEKIMDQLDEETKRNYNDFIPIIFKFNTEQTKGDNIGTGN